MSADPFDIAARFAAPDPTPRGPGAGDEDEESDEYGPGEAAYVCDACGEEIVVPVDPAAGARQEYVEDCPVCCRPNVLTATVGPDGGVRLDARPE